MPGLVASGPPVSRPRSSHANAARYRQTRAPASRASARRGACGSNMRTVAVPWEMSRTRMMRSDQRERASSSRRYELFVRNTSSSPSAVPISDMGTGDVRGSSTPGRPATTYAHSEAVKQTGATARRTVEWRQEQKVASHRKKVRLPVYDCHVRCVKRRVKLGSPETMPETLTKGSRPDSYQSPCCTDTSSFSVSRLGSSADTAASCDWSSP